MQCVKCGAQLPEGSSYCNICGKKQQAAAAAEKKRKTKTRGNGTGSAFKEGKTWMVRVVLGYWTDEQGKRHMRTASKHGFPTKKDALDYVPTLKSQAAQNASLTLSGYWEFYEAKKLPELSRDKQTAYRIAWRRWAALATRFQSTHPVRGGTNIAGVWVPSFIISIHPPRAGWDTSSTHTACPILHFNPPTPCGVGRTMALLILSR